MYCWLTNDLAAQLVSDIWSLKSGTNCYFVIKLWHSADNVFLWKCSQASKYNSLLQTMLHQRRIFKTPLRYTLQSDFCVSGWYIPCYSFYTHKYHMTSFQSVVFQLYFFGMHGICFISMKTDTEGAALQRCIGSEEDFINQTQCLKGKWGIKTFHRTPVKTWLAVQMLIIHISFKAIWLNGLQSWSTYATLTHKYYRNRNCVYRSEVVQ